MVLVFSDGEVKRLSFADTLGFSKMKVSRLPMSLNRW